MNDSPPRVVADVATRIMASFVDGLIYLPLGWLVFVLGPGDGALARVAGLSVAALWNVSFVSWRGQTPGKMALGIRIERVESRDVPDPFVALVRWGVFVGPTALAVGLNVPGLDLLWIVLLLISAIRHPLKRGIHDLAAGTIVVAAR